MPARIVQRCSVTFVALALCLVPVLYDVPADAPATVSSVPARPVLSVHPVTGLAARLRAHVDSLAGAGGHRSRVVFTGGNSWSVGYVLRRMRESTSDIRADTFLVARRGSREPFPLVNPIAMVPGSSDTLLVIGAHLDASASRDAGWSRNWRTMPAPGADDNASGVAALLEVLDLAVHSSVRPRYTLMFVAFNAEEKNPDYAGHHLGSRHLARRLMAEGRRVHGAIVLDMVGWNPREQYVGLFASGRGQRLAGKLRGLCGELGLLLDLPSSFVPCPYSDNDSFDRAGIPAVLFMESCRPWRSEGRTSRNPAYHSRRDLPEVVNYGVLTRVTKLVAAYVVR